MENQFKTENIPDPTIGEVTSEIFLIFCLLTPVVYETI